MKRLLACGFALVLAAASAGCNTYLARHAPPAFAAPAVSPAGMDVYYAPYKGTLWQERGRESNLFADHIARRVNDIIHVEIVEQSEALNEADTETNRESNHKAGAPNAFGLLAAFAAQNHWFNLSPTLETETGNAYSADGSTTRKGELKGKISARIIELLPNKHYRIEGRQHLTVNNEEQYIVVQGVVREEDIQPNNIVVSTDIADSKIWYTGRGVVAEQQKPGFLGPVIDLFWPF